MKYFIVISYEIKLGEDKTSLKGNEFLGANEIPVFETEEAAKAAAGRGIILSFESDKNKENIIETSEEGNFLKNEQLKDVEFFVVKAVAYLSLDQMDAMLALLEKDLPVIASAETKDNSTRVAGEGFSAGALAIVAENIEGNVNPQPAVATFDLVNIIKEYLRRNKQLNDAQIDGYVSGATEMGFMTEKGIVRAVNYLKWLGKEGLVENEKSFITYVLLTHQYKAWGARKFGEEHGDLQTAVWNAYRAAKQPQITIHEAADYLYEHDLKGILDHYPAQAQPADIADEDQPQVNSEAKSYLVNLREQIGKTLDERKPAIVEKAALDNEIQSFIAGTATIIPEKSSACTIL